jgi:acetyltransferase
VTDTWQARGVGTTLTRLLFEYARAQGVRALRARILASNHRMIAFVRSLGMKVHATAEDASILEASMDL